MSRCDKSKAPYGAMLALVFPAFLMGMLVFTPAHAAPIKDVLSACDKTAGCSYSINDKTGDISGCSTKSGKCFYCPNDGKKECFAVRRLPQGTEKPILTSPGV